MSSTVYSGEFNNAFTNFIISIDRCCVRTSCVQLRSPESHWHDTYRIKWDQWCYNLTFRVIWRKLLKAMYKVLLPTIHLSFHSYRLCVTIARSVIAHILRIVLTNEI